MIRAEVNVKVRMITHKRVNEGKYLFWKTGQVYTADELISYYENETNTNSC